MAAVARKHANAEAQVANMGTGCALLAVPNEVFESGILRRVPEARDRAALARCCRALRHAASWYEDSDARVVVAVGAAATKHGGDPTVSLEQRWQWAAHAAARTRGQLALAGFRMEDIDRLRGIAAAAGFHPRLRELALPDLRTWPPDVEQLKKLASAGPGLPAAFEKVSVETLFNPEAAWASRGPAGEPPVLSTRAGPSYLHKVASGNPSPAAVAASIPLGSNVYFSGGNRPESESPAAAEVTEALAEREIKQITFRTF